ncbi:MAG TPA: ABC transporter ATP-binding protein [Rhodoferax sp.]
MTNTTLSGAADGALLIQGVSKTYQQKEGPVLALADIDLSIAEGEFVSIVGGSGCGKSTLLRIIAGFETEYQGRVTLGGKAIHKPGLDRGMVFQEHRLLPWLTVEQNIALGLNGMTDEQVQQRIDEHLELVGLIGFAKAYPGQLSGGMSQRVAIARALANQPQILLLDEPFGALDALTKIQMQNEALRIWQAEKMTMILVTHDIDEAIFLGDRVVVMSARPGTIKTIVPIHLPRPRDRTSADFMALRRTIYGEFFTQAKTEVDFAI